MSTVVLVRQAATDFDEQGRIQGTLDLPLNRRGEEQLTEILAALRPLDVEAIYSSPTEPSRSMAQRLADERGLDVKELEGLKNIDHGLWQGLQVDEIRRKHPKVFRQWQDCPTSICPPEGEMLTPAVDRIRRALKHPLKKRGTVVIVAPEPVAGVVRCLISNCSALQTCLATDERKPGTWEVMELAGLADAESAARNGDSGVIAAVSADAGRHAG